MYRFTVWAQGIFWLTSSGPAHHGSRFPSLNHTDALTLASGPGYCIANPNSEDQINLSAKNHTLSLPLFILLNQIQYSNKDYYFNVFLNKK